MYFQNAFNNLFKHELFKVLELPILHLFDSYLNCNRIGLFLYLHTIHNCASSVSVLNIF